MPGDYRRFRFGQIELTRVLFGLGSADSGEITYRGQTMGKRGSAVRRMLRGQTGLVFQDPSPRSTRAGASHVP